MSSPKRELTLAIKAAGSVKAAAMGMGVTASTVSRWRKKGVPEQQRDRLAFFRTSQKAEREASRPDTSGRDLKRMLKAAKTIKELARQLGYSPSTVSRWLKKGLPRAHSKAREVIAMVREARATRREEQTAEVKRLKELRKLAARVRRSEGRPLPPVKSHAAQLDGPRAHGVTYTKAINSMLSEGALEDIERWARTHRRRWPYWQLTVNTTMYSKNQEFSFPKSGARVDVMVATDDRNAFVAEQAVAGPRNKDMGKVIDYVRAALEEMSGNTANTVFVLTASLWNYRLRTPDERKKREAEYRASREALKKKKTRKTRSKKAPKKGK